MEKLRNTRTRSHSSLGSDISQTKNKKSNDSLNLSSTSGHARPGSDAQHLIIDMDLNSRLKTVVNEICNLIDQLTILLSECSFNDSNIYRPGFTDNQYVDSDALRRSYLCNLVALRLALTFDIQGWSLYNYLKDIFLSDESHLLIKNRRDSYIKVYLSGKWNQWVSYKKDDELTRDWPSSCWSILNLTNKRIVWGYVETVVALLGNEELS